MSRNKTSTTITATAPPPTVQELDETIPVSVIKTDNEFVRFIRHKREELGKTQAEIAKACHYISGEYWGLIEAGKRRMDQEKVPLLADALNLSRQTLTKLFLKVTAPNVYSTFWGDEELDRIDPAEAKKFVQITESSVALLNKIHSLSPSRRRMITEMVDMAYKEMVKE